MADCKEILMQGVYEYHIANRTGNLDQDYKHYFASDEFRKDFKSFKFKLGVEALIDDIPLKLNADSEDNQINEFQKKVRESTTFKVTKNFFEQNIHEIPNKDIIDAWKECAIEGFGFKIENRIEGNIAIFDVAYSNFGPVAELPVLEKLFVANGVLLDSTIAINERFENNSNHKFICQFTNEFPINLTIDTSFTGISDSAYLVKKRASSDGNPIGTIISSFLNWEEFQKTTENNKQTKNGLWNSEFSYWSPCDGREVQNSEFLKITNQSHVPDARGLFLRGLNSFDKYELDAGINVVLPDQKDPEDNRFRGKFQGDELKSHPHTTSLYGSTGGGNNFAVDGKISSTDNVLRFERSNTVHPFGGAETRPKNIAIYYYIKIN